MFHKTKSKERKGMGVVLPQAIVERSILVRQLVDGIQKDAEELRVLLAQERRESSK